MDEEVADDVLDDGRDGGHRGHVLLDVQLDWHRHGRVRLDGGSQDGLDEDRLGVVDPLARPANEDDEVLDHAMQLAGGVRHGPGGLDPDAVG
jgi:hypothetical protein